MRDMSGLFGQCAQSNASSAVGNAASKSSTGKYFAQVLHRINEFWSLGNMAEHH